MDFYSIIFTYKTQVKKKKKEEVGEKYRRNVSGPVENKLFYYSIGRFIYIISTTFISLLQRIRFGKKKLQ